MDNKEKIARKVNKFMRDFSNKSEEKGEELPVRPAIVISLIHRSQTRIEGKTNKYLSEGFECKLAYEAALRKTGSELYHTSLDMSKKSNIKNNLRRDEQIKTLVEIGNSFREDVNDIAMVFASYGDAVTDEVKERFEGHYRISYMRYTSEMIKAADAYTEYLNEDTELRQAEGNRIQNDYSVSSDALKSKFEQDMRAIDVKYAEMVGITLETK